MKDAAGEVVARGHEPDGSCVMYIGEALENAGKALACAAGDANSLRIRLNGVMPGKPLRHTFAQRPMAFVGAILEGGRVSRLVVENVLASSREQAGRQDVGRRPAAHEIDLSIGRGHRGRGEASRYLA